MLSIPTTFTLPVHSTNRAAGVCPVYKTLVRGVLGGEGDNYTHRESSRLGFFGYGGMIWSDALIYNKAGPPFPLFPFKYKLTFRESR